jgi:hypothetical protein
VFSSEKLFENELFGQNRQFDFMPNFQPLSLSKIGQMVNASFALIFFQEN